MSVKFPPAILGLEMAAPILWAPGLVFGSKTSMPIKFLIWGGGGDQRAENGALDLWSLNLRFLAQILGRPDFQSRGPKTLI